MTGGSGYLVTYQDKAGKTRRGIVYHSVQTKPILNQGKVIVWLLDDDLKPTSEMPVIVRKEKLRQVGFTD